MATNSESTGSRIQAFPDPFKPRQWYDDNTYYQILLVEPNMPCESTSKNLKTTLVLRTRGEFKSYKLDGKTKENLKDYPVADQLTEQSGSKSSEDHDAISSYLPSSGVVLDKGFLKAVLGNTDHVHYPSIEINNFNEPIRTLLHTRKTSQLIAKTWYAYLQALENNQQIWKNFTRGNWDSIDSPTLDGLIAREIFLFSPQSVPDILDPEKSEQYDPSNNQEKPRNNARFIIMPTSISWQGIGLQLLMSGQVYYKTMDNNGNDYYHQVTSPILSTGEIVSKYQLDVSWEKFTGTIKEMKLAPNSPSNIYRATIPYPPIPDGRNLPTNDIYNWAYADDENGPFPFYIKDSQGDYLVNEKYYTPPYPYIPLSCT